MKVFLGGTCNNTTWRDKLIPMLEEAGIDYFNPVVEDWTEDCQAEEERQKWEECDIHLYVVTPLHIGYYTFAEIIDSAGSIKTIFAFSAEDNGLKFNKGQIRSLEAIADMVNNYGETSFGVNTIDQLLDYLVEELRGEV